MDMALKPGEMTDAIETGYEAEWAVAKPNPLPDAGKEDRRLLFAGIARGILQYLSDHHNELLTTITTQDEVGTTATLQITETDLGIDVS
jgi:hypothetical protein